MQKTSVKSESESRSFVFDSLQPHVCMHTHMHAHRHLSPPAVNHLRWSYLSLLESAWLQGTELVFVEWIKALWQKGESAPTTHLFSVLPRLPCASGNWKHEQKGWSLSEAPWEMSWLLGHLFSNDLVQGYDGCKDGISQDPLACIRLSMSETSASFSRSLWLAWLIHRWVSIAPFLIASKGMLLSIHRALRSLFINTSHYQEDSECLGEMTEARAGWRRYHTSVGHLEVPEDKKVLKEW